MKKTTFTAILILLLSYTSTAQPVQYKLQFDSIEKARTSPALVDFEAFEQLVKQVKKHREKHLLSLANFFKMASEKDVVILDTRSDSMYKRKHIKGAIHLDFTDFTQLNLRKLIPNKNTRILIYCNNNFRNDEENFATKARILTPQERIQKPITLALNIPTYINLFGYGYTNVFELSELVSVNNPIITFEGTTVVK